jgi:hypothetical protein
MGCAKSRIETQVHTLEQTQYIQNERITQLELQIQRIQIVPTTLYNVPLQSTIRNGVPTTTTTTKLPPPYAPHIYGTNTTIV